MLNIDFSIIFYAILVIGVAVALVSTVLLLTRATIESIRYKRFRLPEFDELAEDTPELYEKGAQGRKVVNPLNATKFTLVDDVDDDLIVEARRATQEHIEELKLKSRGQSTGRRSLFGGKGKKKTGRHGW